MQGMPIQLLSKSAKATGLADQVSAKAGAGVAVEGSQNDFGSLFESLTASTENGEVTAEVSSSKGEMLKALLGQSAEGEEQIIVDENQVAALFAALGVKPELNALGKTEAAAGETAGHVEQTIAKTGNNLDQLLNSLKGTQDNSEVIEETGNDLLQDVRLKKGERLQKGELKAESPLDFLMNGAKNKDLSVNLEAGETSELESIIGQNKMMTGEDYLKNMESSDKKGAGKQALLNALELPKNPNQNVKAYGQGLTLLSDPLIRNTKDLAFKDGNKGKNASVDELRSPDLKVGAELSVLKQDVIPMMQNKENNGQQTGTQTQSSEKVLDLGKINTANTNEIIKRISDYVEQNQVANKSSLDLTVKHESLGEFKIQVSKMPGQSTVPGQNMIDMQITTSSKEGHDFFMKNEIGLMKNLNNAGINLSDLRIVSSMSDTTSSGQTDSRQSNSNQNPDSNGKQFNSSGSFSSEFSNGKERRKELWEEYQQRYGA